MDQAAHEKAQASAAAEKKPENRIAVPDTLTDPHPLVARTLKSLASAKPNDKGLVRPRASKCLGVEVSPALIDRAMRILDALIRALGARDHAVSAGEGDEPRTWVTVLGEKLSIWLEEGLNCQAQVQSFLDRTNEYTYTPSGALSLCIGHGLGSGYRQRWSDGKKCLDGMLNKVATGLVAAAEANKVARAEAERRERERKEEQKRREEEEKHREERERLKRLEAARVQDFGEKLDAWERAGRIRAFAAAVRAEAETRNGSIPPGSELDRWLLWAFARADRIDPVTTERPERKWPPPAGLTVKITGSEYGSWWKDGTDGTPLLPPPGEKTLPGG